MPDDLYDRDVLEWAEQQAALLRRIARGERVNDLDWEHVAEEIEDVGLSELSAVRSYLRQLLLHMMKLCGWPACQTCEHWRNELDIFQAEAAERFTPTMRQRLDIPTLSTGATSREPYADRWTAARSPAGLLSFHAGRSAVGRH
jgi:Domain of unknown function DUF29